MLDGTFVGFLIASLVWLEAVMIALATSQPVAATMAKAETALARRRRR